MCDVRIMNTRAEVSNYIQTMPSVSTVTRGTGIALQDMGQAADTLTISTGRDLGLYLDLADYNQSPWSNKAELFDRIGALLNEYIENGVLATYASWTEFGTSSIGGGGAATDAITVSASNIDDIIRGVKREVREANGQFLWNQNGLGFVWRASDFEYLEAFVQANGFATADKALKEGTVEGLRYLGVDHYWSNDHTATHVFAGVKKVQRLGILRGTYGQAHEIKFPGVASASYNFLSGVALYSRVDIGHLTPTAHVGLLFDVNVVTP